MNEDKYIKGFNAGYLMQEKDPDLFKKLNENLANYNLKSDPFYAKLIEFSAKL